MKIKRFEQKNKKRSIHADRGGPMWNFFERIYCINLADRHDRREHAQAQFERIGLSGRVEFVTVERHPSDCEQGIYESHLRCIRKALYAGARNMVIFEDDVVFERFDSGRLKNCVRFLEDHPQWQFFFWGCLMNAGRPAGHSNVIEISYRCLAHAYALNRSAAEAVLKKPWHDVPYDVMLRTFKEEVYAVRPAFAFQGDLTTDNRRLLWLDRCRRWCGGLKRIQKANEWICLNRKLFIALHLFAAAALTGLALLWGR